ncbi:MAG: RIP metalloprotease RseP [Alphaproteobacteria bacterium]
MITTLTYLFAFVVVLSLVVIVHEGGHFFAARRCGVKVTDFSLGFGPELWGRVDKKGTRWKVCAIPLGGYVKMLGDEDAASAQKSTAHVAPEDLNKTFLGQKLWKRALIIFAGPAMNYVLAFLLLTGLFYAFGTLTIPPVIGEVMPDSAAQKAGLLAGDKILSVNGQQINSFTDIRRSIQLNDYAKELTITLDRAGTELTVQVGPLQETENGPALLGVTAASSTFTKGARLSFLGAVGEAGQMLWTTSRDSLKYLGQVLTGQRKARDLRGPLGIAEASGDALQGGLISLLTFIAYVSIAIGLMNLLPIPVLDGGHLFFYALEAIFRRPIPEKIENAFVWGGFGVLMLIFAYSLVLDVPRIWERIMG